MTVFSDVDLRKMCDMGLLDPYPEDVQFQPASIDLRLGTSFKVPQKKLHKFSDVELKMGDSIILTPGEFLLATTLEEVNLKGNIAARIEGRSSLGRRGLLAHATAGWIDPGFRGQITLELVNVSPWNITLDVGSRVCQIAVWKLSSPVRRLYGTVSNKYQNQHKATEALPDFPDLKD